MVSHLGLGKSLAIVGVAVGGSMGYFLGMVIGRAGVWAVGLFL